MAVRASVMPLPRLPSAFPTVYEPRLRLLPDDTGGDWDGRSEIDFEATVTPHLKPMVSVARGILGSEDLAWDAVQEALLSFWREDELPPNPRAWLLRTVTHRSIHLLRTRSRRRKHEERAAAARFERCTCNDPARIAADQEFCSELEKALARLPHEQRQVFLLREVEQLDYAAIADALRVPVGTIRSRLNRARAALRDLLQDRFDPS